MTHDAFWVRLISDDRLLDIAQAFIGPDIALFASHYICKPPRDGKAVLWHQDGSYWPLDPMRVITIWLAVDEATPANGCMRVVPGSQHLDLQALRERTDVPNVLNSGMDEDLVDAGAAVDIILRPGDVSLHHPNVIHGSEANLSDTRRGGLTIRYIPTTTRITAKWEWPSAFLLRGKAVDGINAYHPWPVFAPETSMDFGDRVDWDRRCREYAGDVR
jgi:hypothetical protein